MNEEWFIAIATNAALLLCSLWAISVRMTWKAGQTKAEIIGAITGHAKEDEAEFNKVRAELYKATHDFGETIMALKQHINDIQLQAAQLYIRREGFYESMNKMSEGLAGIRVELTGSITALRSELRDDLKRMEQKIDQKT